MPRGLHVKPKYFRRRVPALYDYFRGRYGELADSDVPLRCDDQDKREMRRLLDQARAKVRSNGRQVRD
jgi:hypothetical protein